MRIVTWEHPSRWERTRTFWALGAYTVTVILLLTLIASPAFAVPCVQPLAHRGFHNAYVDEDSLPSIRNAPNAEIDVRVTADGGLVLMHDENVRRTTNGSGYVSEMTLAKVKQLRLEITRTRVPTFREAARVAGNRDSMLVVELKLFTHWTPQLFEKVTRIADWAESNGATVYLGGHGSGFERELPKYASHIYWRPNSSYDLTPENARLFDASMVMAEGRRWTADNVDVLRGAGVVTAFRMRGTVRHAREVGIDYMMTDTPWAPPFCN